VRSVRILFGVSVFWLALSMLSDGLNTLFLPYALLRLGGDEQAAGTAGLLRAGGLLAGMLVMPLAGAWSDRLAPQRGRRRAQRRRHSAADGRHHFRADPALRRADGAQLGRLRERALGAGGRPGAAGYDALFVTAALASLAALIALSRLRAGRPVVQPALAAVPVGAEADERRARL
jgi:hypothetical protein